MKPTEQQRRLSRRNAMKMSGAAVAGALLPMPTAKAQQREAASGKPKNIIFMVADGMSHGVPPLAEAFSRLTRGPGTIMHMWHMMPKVTRGLFDMASLDSLVTDSAAAATAWGAGSRVFNDAINILPDGRSLTPILALAAKRGLGTGLVTTTRITHATPAGFAAVVPKRDFEDDIAQQYLGVVDVLLGGGGRHFDPVVRADRRDLAAEFTHAGYHLCRTRDEFLAAPRRGRLLGLFHADHLPYVIDQRRDQALKARTPTLAEMTKAALETLAARESGFILQVEGGRVDHAAHDNDGPGLLHEQLAFDDALDVVQAFALSHPDTLVIVTSDHGTANPGLMGLGSTYHRSNAAFEKTSLATASIETIVAGIKALQPGAGGAGAGGNVLPAAVAEVIARGSGLDIDERQCTQLAAALNGGPVPELSRIQATLEGLVGQITGNHTGIGFTGITHTSDWTPLFALGPGAERFQGLVFNIAAFKHITELLEIEHRNPAMTPSEAQRFDRRRA